MRLVLCLEAGASRTETALPDGRQAAHSLTEQLDERFGPTSAYVVNPSL